MHLKPVDEAVPAGNVAGQHPSMARLTMPTETRPSLAEVGASQFASALHSRRFRLELDWLEQLPGLGKAAAVLLAAHAVGCLTTIRPGSFGASPGHGVFSGLASLRPGRVGLEREAAGLLLEAGVTEALSAADLANIDALWPLTAPAEYLLASGGDDRLTLDPATGLNKYGCAPWPRPNLISFGSCTASSLSEGAFDAAERARRSLAQAALATSPATALAEASEAVSTALLQYFGVEDLAEAVLAASGTDAALVVTGLLAAEHPGQAMTSILVSPSETGSGVPDAVQGRHFASSAPSGSLVGKGEPIDGLTAGPALVTVPLRDETGEPRPPAEIDADFGAVIRSCAAKGQVVLHAMDGSKTGLSAPDRALCRRLSQAYGAQLDIVIDACQGRIEPALVRWYLQQGYPVLVTGSKFFSAPGFCGAVLFPRQRLHWITRAGRLPAGLAAYARLQGGFGSRRCPGLILRWTAALHEMAVFEQIPEQYVRANLDRVGHVITAGIARDSRLRMVAAPRPAGMGWSDLRSIFTFTVRGPEGRMSSGQLREFYRQMGEDCSALCPGGGARCQIGQPVDLARSGLGGLRIAISAAQLASGYDHTEAVNEVLKKLGGLLNRSFAA